MAKKILIAEDHRPLAKALALKLKKSGFETTIATNGLETLKDLKHKSFDLLLLDLILPKIDGFTILKKLKARHDDIPVIVSTNLSQTEDKEKVKEFGVKEYLVKSEVSLLDLVNKVKKYAR